MLQNFPTLSSSRMLSFIILDFYILAYLCIIEFQEQKYDKIFKGD